MPECMLSIILYLFKDRSGKMRIKYHEIKEIMEILHNKKIESSQTLFNIYNDLKQKLPIYISLPAFTLWISSLCSSRTYSMYCKLYSPDSKKSGYEENEDEDDSGANGKKKGLAFNPSSINATSFLSPLLVLQLQLKKKILGEKIWQEFSISRLSDSKSCDLLFTIRLNQINIKDCLDKELDSIIKNRLKNEEIILKKNQIENKKLKYLKYSSPTISVSSSNSSPSNSPSNSPSHSSLSPSSSSSISSSSTNSSSSLSINTKFFIFNQKKARNDLKNNNLLFSNSPISSKKITPSSPIDSSSPSSTISTNSPSGSLDELDKDIVPVISTSPSAKLSSNAPLNTSTSSLPSTQKQGKRRRKLKPITGSISSPSSSYNLLSSTFNSSSSPSLRPSSKSERISTSNRFRNSPLIT